MQGILRSFVCTFSDKAANNMALSCKPFYASILLGDLVRLGADGNVAYVQTDLSEDDVIGASSFLLEEMQISAGQPFVPGYMASPKFHKPSTAFRFIATCSKSWLKPLALQVTYMLRAVESDLDSIWGELRFPTALRGGRARHWSNSSQLLPTIHAFNSSRSLEEAAACAPFLLSYDFQHLYTELDQANLKAKLCWLLDRIFALRQTRPILQVASKQPPRWRTGPDK